VPAHPLLSPESIVVAVACGHMGADDAHVSFLAPWAGGLVRVTVLNCRDERADHSSAVVMVSPPGDLSGMGLSGLRVLGRLLQGWDAEQIAIRSDVPQVAIRVRRLAGSLGCAGIHTLLMHAAPGASTSRLSCGRDHARPDAGGQPS
jgi:hypothetical protein